MDQGCPYSSEKRGKETSTCVTLSIVHYQCLSSVGVGGISSRIPWYLCTMDNQFQNAIKNFLANANKNELNLFFNLFYLFIFIFWNKVSILLKVKQHILCFYFMLII